MSEHDVPAERDELRRNFAAWLDEWRFCPACDVQLQRSTGTEFVPTGHRHEDDCVLAGILALLAAARPAPETREPELLGYVVERQLTTGEWMRVWRGRTMWFDHDEAVLDRDAYALDGIPAHIRPVYLGAPAPAEGTEASDALRSAIEAMGDLHRALLHMGRGRLRAAEATERSES